MKLIIAILVSVILNFNLISSGSAKDHELKLNYFGNVDRKLRFAVFDQPQQFRDTFQQQDKFDLFDHDFLPSDLIEVDVLIIFFKSWKQVDDIAGDLAFLKPILSDHDDRQFLHLEKITFEAGDGRKKFAMGFFYNTKEIKNKPIHCFADDIIRVLTKKQYSNKYNGRYFIVCDFKL